MRVITDLADFIIIVVDGKIMVNAPKDEIKGNLLFNDFVKIGKGL